MLLLMISIKTFIIESALAKLNSDELIYVLTNGNIYITHK
jgi:hypothetical protein